MTTDIFRTRERALEYEFFHKVDERLWQQLRDKLEFDKHRQALADATGITDEPVLDRLVELGISSESMYALSLFPLVWVAWADGIIEQEQRKAILASVRASGHEQDTVSQQLIENWLDHKPDEKLIAAWKDYVATMCKHTTPATRNSLKEDVLSRARNVAEAVSARYGFHAAEASQDKVLAEIEKAFNVT